MSRKSQRVQGENKNKGEVKPMKHSWRPQLKEIGWFFKKNSPNSMLPTRDTL